MNWTDERVEKLKKLWSEGLSASQIAAQLGGVSRNAVIGKVHRLNLPGRAKAGGTAAAARTPKRGASAPRASNYTSRVATRTVTRQQGATMLKEEVDRYGQRDPVSSSRQCRRSDLPASRPDGADGAHLQVACRRPAEGRLPLLRQRKPGCIALLRLPSAPGLPAGA